MKLITEDRRRTTKTRCRLRVEALEARALLNAGDLDLTFAGTGMATAAVGTGNDGGGAVAVQPDLKVVVAGGAGNNNPGQQGKTFTPAIAFGLAGHNADGTPDTSFGTGGTGQ